MKSATAKNYDNRSITALKGADRVRKRPSVIFGSDGLEGCQHSVFEILSNAIDEHREGYGNKITVKLHKDSSVTVSDQGRGIPVEYNELERKYNWELIFCELYAGGKFESETNYTYSLGLNGLGLCSTQYASEYMDVTVYRDGFKYSLHFEHGENVGDLSKEPTNSKQTGTVITWKPDREVFTDIEVPITYFQETLKRQAIVNPGLIIELYNEKDEENPEQPEIICYNEGIKDYLKEISQGKELTDPVYLTHEGVGRDRADKPEYKLKLELIFCFNNFENRMEYYHNSSFLEHGGSPDKAIRSGFLWALDNYLKSNNLYKKDEKKLTFADIEDSLILICSSFSTMTSYENQTKKSITNKFIQDSITEFLKKQLEVYFIENLAEAQKIAAQVLVNKRSRETAEKTRQSIRLKLTGGIDIGNRVEKFVNCRTKDKNRRELYIVEGDSALGSCKMGRDAEFQAIIPVRGKILNCLKADYDKIFNNDIILDILRVLGCGVEIKSKHNKDLNSFDFEQLRWNKVIICTDADVDGFQIRTLILTMLYRLVPTLIRKGKIHIAESPLYEITSAKKTYFAYSDKEKNQIVSKLSGKCKIQRSKGLGENEPEMMWETTMNPETRKLICVMPEDLERTQSVFELLLGDNLKGRKEFIEEYGHKYIDLVETV